jgi:release factor glutamine methyltransferase
VLVEGIEIVSWNGVYFPAEDTLLMLRSIAEGDGNFLDVGTGTGILGISAAMNGYAAVSTDIDMKCLISAGANAEANGVAVDLVRCDLAGALRGPFEVIAFNPPYLPEEGVRDSQLTGGEEGFELSLRLLSQAQKLLSSGGTVRIVLSSMSGIDRFASLAGSEWDISIADSVKLDFETLHLLEARRRRAVSAPSP